MPFQDLAFVPGDTALSSTIRNNTASNSKLVFPEERGEYPGSITFYAIEENFLDVANEIQNANLVAANNQIIDFLDFQSFDGSQNTSKKGRTDVLDGTPKGSVSLYLPQSLQFTDGVEYGNVALGARGGAVERALQNGGVSLGSVIGAIGADIPILDLLTKGITSDAGVLAAQRVLGRRAGEEVTGALESTTGLTLNPNVRSLLRGVNLRRFRFTFKLIPKNATESNRIKQIIQFFRESMYPEDVTVAGVNVGYKFPYKFVIKPRYRGAPVATGILPCFLENFDTNYNPNTMGMMSDGSFPEVDISLGFIESRTLRKKDVQGGY